MDKDLTRVLHDCRLQPALRHDELRPDVLRDASSWSMESLLRASLLGRPRVQSPTRPLCSTKLDRAPNRAKHWTFSIVFQNPSISRQQRL